MTKVPALRIAIIVMLVIAAAMPWLAVVLNEPFYVDLALRALVFGIAALSLDLILGFGGLVSLGHAAYLGIGAYSVAILSFYGIGNGYTHFAVAVVASALASLVIGSISLRTSGVYFIMVTLAFAQMVYFLGVSVNLFGGDDGISIAARSDFGLFSLEETSTLYYFVFGSLIIILLATRTLMASPFGRALVGMRIDAGRMAALGFPVFRYQLVAFVISGAICGYAGALLANQTLFISPAIMHWGRSGEIMVMVIVGGAGTVFGGVLGAGVFVILEHALSTWTTHWQLPFGVLMIVSALFFRGGLLGSLGRRS